MSDNKPGVRSDAANQADPAGQQGSKTNPQRSPQQQTSQQPGSQGGPSALIENFYKGLLINVDTSEARRIKEFFDSYIKAITPNNFTVGFDPATARGFLNETLQYSTLKVPAVPLLGGKLTFATPHTEIVASPHGVRAKSTTKEFTIEDALIFAQMAALNKACLPPNRVILEGSQEQMVLLQQAIEKVNQSLAPDLRMNIANPAHVPAAEPDGNMEIHDAAPPADAPSEQEQPEAASQAGAAFTGASDAVVFKDLKDPENEALIAGSAILIKNDYEDLGLIIDYPNPATEEEQNSHTYENFELQKSDTGFFKAAVKASNPDEVIGAAGGQTYTASSTATFTYIAPRSNQEIATSLVADVTASLKEQGIKAIFAEIKNGSDPQTLQEYKIFRGIGAEKVKIKYEQPVYPDAGDEDRIKDLGLYVAFTEPNLTPEEKIDIVREHLVAFIRESDPSFKNAINRNMLNSWTEQLAAVLKRAPAASAPGAAPA